MITFFTLPQFVTSPSILPVSHSFSAVKKDSNFHPASEVELKSNETPDPRQHRKSSEKYRRLRQRQRKSVAPASGGTRRRSGVSRERSGLGLIRVLRKFCFRQWMCRFNVQLYFWLVAFLQGTLLLNLCVICRESWGGRDLMP